MPDSRTGTERYDAELLGHSNAAALRKLRHGYEQFYDITVTFPREWKAVPKDGGPALEADDPELLREAIMADHDARPFPRPLPPGDGPAAAPE